MRKTVVTLGLAFVLVAALGMDVRAQVTFSNPGPDLQTFLNRTGLTQEQLGAKLQELIGASGFLKNVGDAQSFTSKGLGVDYASEATYFEVGGSASFAFGVDKTYQPGNNPANSQAFPLQGAGLNASVMAGLSLGFLKIPVMVFGNWMQLPTQRYGAWSGSLDNWGLHAQLRLFGPSRTTTALKMLIRWGGIAITSGYDSSHMNLGLIQPFSSSFAIPGAPGAAASGATLDATGTAGGTAAFNLDMTTRSIPVEVTTSLRLLSLVTAYGGLGFDWQLGGDTKLNVDLAATLRGHIANVQPDPLELGNARAQFGAHAAPSPARVRAILGAQVNLWMLRIFVQSNIAKGNPIMASLAGGLRLAY